MSGYGLILPELLDRLDRDGRWTGELGPEYARRLSPDDDRLVLLGSPFHTIAAEVAGGNEFWTRNLTNVGEIDYDRALIIADFGLGSDSPVVLYYRDSSEPVVMYLKWSVRDSTPSHAWVQTHESFEKLASDLDL